MALVQTLSSQAQDNPFERVAQQNYAGRFQGEGIELRLLPEAGKWTGTVLLKGKNYTVAAEVKGTGLEGQYAEGGQAWPFTGTVNGEQFSFTAGTFTTTLTRQHLPKLDGRWRSEHVLLILDQTGGPYTGRIQFNGTEYAFAAEEKAGDLEGVFKSGEKSFPFRVANEARGLVFNTGSFAEVLTWINATPFADAPRWTNSLGMVLVKVPGTEVLFSIWDTRVQDYQVYAASSIGIDGSWKNPRFSQTTNHPVVDVNWNDAKAFCKWLTEQERADGIISKSQSYRLPTDAEWSMAVGLTGEAGSTPKGKNGIIEDVYPWGTSWPPPSGAGNYADTAYKVKHSTRKVIEGYDDGYVETSPVGSFAANKFGLYDMGGNVWQWCEDWFYSDHKSRVLRGASWCDSQSVGLLSSCRSTLAPDYRLVNFGFRVVLEGGSSR